LRQVGDDGSGGRSGASNAADSRVSVLVVSGGLEEAALPRCLTALGRQTYRRIELILLLQGSTGAAVERAARSAASELEAEVPVTVQRWPAGQGAAGAFNTAVQSASGALCLFLSPSVALEPRAVEELVAAALGHPEITGFAPKVKRLDEPDTIDAVGAAFSWDGPVYRRGRGRIDLGQFDQSEPVRGISLGAALIRRQAFAEHAVGPFDERFAPGGAETDWSTRAGIYGQRFLTVPRAMAFRDSSCPPPRKESGREFRTTERDLYRSAIKNFQLRHLLGFLSRRGRAHLGGLAAGDRTIARARVLAGAAIALVSLQPDRRAVQRGRRKRDAEIVEEREPTFGFGAGGSPVHSWNMVGDSLLGLYAVGGEERWARAYRYLDLMRQFHIRLGPDAVLMRLDEIAGPLPVEVRAYAERMSAR